MADPIVTRFAPSPTGFLHIGGARTALFNWLLSRGNGGRFLLRIEDTDRQRSTEATVDAILEGLTWLGLDWDDEPVRQFSRADHHRAAAERLVSEGKAYPCYASAEELSEMREHARAEGRPPGYDGRWRDRDPGDAPAGVAPAIRLKAPQEGETVVDDAVQGQVVFRNENLDDLILLRSDGTPTYMLAVVVDDHEMGVTHVVRGDDHLTNAARQSQIFQALGWPVPKFAHVPLIHGPDGAKFSKRHGAPGIEDYRALGYLPEALRNYLVRLGWSHGDDEIISDAQMREWFSLDGIGRSPARFDMKKLENLNGHYIRAGSSSQLVTQLRQDLPHYTSPEGGAQLPSELPDETWDDIEGAMPGLQERAKTLAELIDGAAYLYRQRPLTLEPKAAKLLTGDGAAALADVIPVLEGLGDWTREALEGAVKAHAEAVGLKLGKVAQPMRAALTGRTTSPGIYDVLVSLGREESLARLRDQSAG